MTSDHDASLARIDGARDAVLQSIEECFNAAHALFAAPRDSALARRVITAIKTLRSHVSAYAQALRESGMGESEVYPAIREATTDWVNRAGHQATEQVRAEVQQWIASAVGGRRRRR